MESWRLNRWRLTLAAITSRRCSSNELEEIPQELYNFLSNRFAPT